MIQISLPCLHLSFHNACPRYLRSRQDLLYLSCYSLNSQNDTQEWLSRLVATLLRLATHEDHLYLFHHLLSLSWLDRLLIFPPLYLFLVFIPPSFSRSWMITIPRPLLVNVLYMIFLIWNWMNGATCWSNFYTQSISSWEISHLRASQLYPRG